MNAYQPNDFIKRPLWLGHFSSLDGWRRVLHLSRQKVLPVSDLSSSYSNKKLLTLLSMVTGNRAAVGGTFL